VAGLAVTSFPDPAFWRGRRIFLTGHTGFKGSWAALWLRQMGAEVHGYALAPEDPSLFALTTDAAERGTFGDVRDVAALEGALAKAQPGVVLHFAAQALVRRAHARAAETFAVNVQGTVNLLEAIGTLGQPATVLVATTDKVYRNDGSGIAFPETAPLEGNEPYSASKVGQEMAARAYRMLLAPSKIAVVTARAGNVIGGGDFAEDRLIPDIVRAAEAGVPVDIRHPDATRPFQHVLDCLAGYFAYVEAVASGRDLPASLNFGPTGGSARVADVADAMVDALAHKSGWRRTSNSGPAEASALAVDAARARSQLGWSERWGGRTAIDRTADWYRAWRGGDDMRARSVADLVAFEGTAR
jgi:CDP-glucose 4,6-dehydratase